jgi:hypothetical protein
MSLNHPCPHRVPSVSRTRLRTRVPVSLSIDTGHGQRPLEGIYTSPSVSPCPGRPVA